MNAIIKPKISHCFDYSAAMVRAVEGLKIREMFFTASGIVVEFEDVNAGDGEERMYRMTIKPMDN